MPDLKKVLTHNDIHGMQDGVQSQIAHNYNNCYFTIVSHENSNTITFKASSGNLTCTISVSTDNGVTWTSKTSTTSGVTLATLNTNDKLLIKGGNQTYGNGSYYNYFTSTKYFSVEGNIMSLISADNFYNALNTNISLNTTYTFKYLFYNCTKLINAENLILPATTLVNSCYLGMFQGCTSLITAPKLPATTLATGCYSTMFFHCTSLTIAPKLPATTLANGCYRSMFNSCSNLTKAPELPATTLATGCYESMFQDCTSLTKAPELPATTLTTQCYASMFQNCTSLTKAPELPAITLATGCYNGMFIGCTSLTIAPELPATTLESRCYDSMFYSCTSLTKAPELPATTLAEGCYDSMFWGCTSLITAPKLPATTLASNCYTSMFYNCTSLIAAPELPAPILSDYCYRDMFFGCSSLIYGSNILANNYQFSRALDGMFGKCTSLTYIKCLATSGIPDLNIFSDNPPNTLGTFIKHKDAAVVINNNPSSNEWKTGYNIPSYWSIIDAEDDSDYDKQYFTIETFDTTSSITIYNRLSRSSYSINLEYSYDKRQWTEITITGGSSNSTIEFIDNYNYNQPCNKVFFKGINSTFANYEYENDFPNYISFTVSGGSSPAWKVYGNIMSLIYGDNFIGKTDLSKNPYAFYGLFSNNGQFLIDAQNLILPATELSPYCYQGMFSDCINLINTPKLPATSLAIGCYQQMFHSCTALTNAPQLPATSLAIGCYQQMFRGCEKLMNAPQLPATILAEYCYDGMFHSCTSLHKAPELPAPTLIEGCYKRMFCNCPSLSYIRILADKLIYNGSTYTNMAEYFSILQLSGWTNDVSSTGIIEILESELNNSNGFMFECDAWTLAPIILNSTEDTYVKRREIKSSGSGNVITGVTVNNNSIEFTKGTVRGFNSGTSNRMAYYSGNSTIASSTNIYANTSQLSISKTSAPPTGYQFQVVGSSMLRNIIPETTNVYDQGSSSLRWRKIYGQQIDIDSNTAGIAPHINFNRAGHNYINIPTNGSFVVSVNGASSANTRLKVTNTDVTPGEKDNTITLGSTSYYWSHVYTKGNVYVKGTGNMLGSDGNNVDIYLGTNGKYVTLHNSENTFRRGTATASENLTLGTSTYRWKSTYTVDEYIGTDSGSQCHLQFNNTDKCLDFIFD